MTAAARLDLRLDPADKDRILRAADLRGMPVSTFVRDAVLRAADDVMGADNPVTLSPEETQRLLAALDKPFEPSTRLQRALEQGRAVALSTKAGKHMPGPIAARLRGRASARLSTDEIMRLTRGT